MGDVANAAAAPDGVWQRIFTEYIFYNHKTKSLIFHSNILDKMRAITGNVENVFLN